MNPPKRARMSTKPLSYDSLKTVLQHMDANLRFQLSRRIPSIHSAEKSVPLKIETLTFNQMRIAVNKTEYKIGIYRNYRVHQVSEFIDIENDDGGVEHDLDKYGVPDHSSENIFLLGDVIIEGDPGEQDEMAGMTDDERIEQLEEELSGLQEELTENPEDENFSLEMSIADTQHLLSVYKNRRSNALPLYDCYIQLTIESPDFRRVERVEYNVKLHKAQKCLLEALFGNRRHVVDVKRIAIDSDNKIIRLPLGLKFKIREIDAGTDIIKLYEALRPILEESTLPLDRLKLNRATDEQLEYTIVRTARKIVLWWITNNEPLLPVLLKIKNQKALVFFGHEQFQTEDRFLLIQNWLDTSRPVGTCFSFTIKKKKHITDFIGLIKNRFAEAEIEGKCAIIKMNTSSMIKISVEKPTIDCQYDCWILQMSVLSIKSSI